MQGLGVDEDVMHRMEVKVGVRQSWPIWPGSPELPRRGTSCLSRGLGREQPCPQRGGAT